VGSLTVAVSGERWSLVDPVPSAAPQLRQKRSPSFRSVPQLGQYLVIATRARYAQPGFVRNAPAGV
jgi:hypothetical protein